MPPFPQNSPWQMFGRPSPSPPSPQSPARGFPPLFSPAAPPAVQPPTGGGIPGMLSSLLSAGGSQTGGGVNIAGMLTNTQKAIQTAQTILPMIQQFGPLIKNAPAILSILKSMQSDDGEKNSQETQTADKQDAPQEQTGQKHASAIKERGDSKTGSIKKGRDLRHTDNLVTRPSRPRMYI